MRREWLASAVLTIASVDAVLTHLLCIPLADVTAYVATSMWPLRLKRMGTACFVMNSWFQSVVRYTTLVNVSGSTVVVHSTNTCNMSCGLRSDVRYITRANVSCPLNMVVNSTYACNNTVHSVNIVCRCIVAVRLCMAHSVCQTQARAPCVAHSASEQHRKNDDALCVTSSIHNCAYQRHTSM